MINLHLGDSLQAMRDMPDNHYDLAIVDPPYGILSKSGNRLDKYGTQHKQWDNNAPNDEYFEQLKRVSKNQIVWGGNYMPQLWGQPCKGFIFWYKHQPITNWASGELAWTSFDRPARCFDYMCYGNVNQDKNRFHPTQKPIALYAWILENYANKGDRILDTHLGSGSIACACYDAGIALDAWELDPEYHAKAVARFNEYSRQTKLF
jgi:site-specific DNA-methyltransferase (adenine-specific)